MCIQNRKAKYLKQKTSTPNACYHTCIYACNIFHGGDYSLYLHLLHFESFIFKMNESGDQKLNAKVKSLTSQVEDLEVSCGVEMFIYYVFYYICIYLLCIYVSIFCIKQKEVKRLLQS